jgi:hypothetical protein
MKKKIGVVPRNRKLLIKNKKLKTNRVSLFFFFFFSLVLLFLYNFMKGIFVNGRHWHFFSSLRKTMAQLVIFKGRWGWDINNEVVVWGGIYVLFPKINCQQFLNFRIPFVELEIVEAIFWAADAN